MHYSARFGLWMALIIGAPHAQADSASEDIFFEELPVVLSASKLAQPELEVPATITILTREEIEATGARTIPEVFRFVPGFQVGHFNGGTAVVTSHGVSDRHSRRIQVLVDGRSIYTPAFGGISWESLPLSINDIEKIEVIRGPNAALYGSNSFSAVINIQTKFSAGTAVSGIWHTREDYERSTTQATYSKVGNDYELSVNTFYRESDGFGDQPDDSNKRDFRTGKRFKEIPDDIRTKSFNTFYNYQLTPNLQLISDFGVLETVRKEGDGGLDEPIHDLNIDSHYLRLKLDHTSDAGHNLFFQIFETRVKTAEDTILIPLGSDEAFDIPELGGDVAVNLIFEEIRREAEIQFTPQISDRIRLVTGGSIRQDEVIGKQIFAKGEEEFHVFRLFANTEVEVQENLRITFGGMLEDHEYTGVSFSPKFATVYILNEQQSVRFVVSHAKRSPTAWEEEGIVRFFIPVAPFEDLTGVDLPADILYFQRYAMEGDLDNEEITSYEIGFKTIAGNELSYDIRLFHEDINDLIFERTRDYNLQEDGQLSQNQIDTINALSILSSGAISIITFSDARGSGTAFSTTNSVDLTIQGLEFEGSLQVTDRLRSYMGFAYLNLSIDSYGENNGTVDEERLEESREEIENSIPKFSGYFGLSYSPTRNSRVNAALLHFDEVDWLGRGDEGLRDQNFLQIYASMDRELNNSELNLGIGLLEPLSTFRDFDEKNEVERHAYVKAGLSF